MRDAFLDLPSSDTPTETLNFSKGTAAWCLEAIVTNNDLMEARGRIKKNREEGKLLTEQMQELKNYLSIKSFILVDAISESRVLI